MDFLKQKPFNHFLSTLVDYYFFLDVPASALSSQPEYVLPFPRITFGYFFDHPFLVTNHDIGQSIGVDMVISRISMQKITVQPQTDHVKILGAHVRPYALAALTNEPVSSLPWLIKTKELFREKAVSFENKINECQNSGQMFEEVENIFLDNILVKDLSVIMQAVDSIDAQHGNIRLIELANQVGVSERTLRNRFHKDVGCAPKEYMELVKLKWSVHEMRNSISSLTEVGYDNSYFDQAHFIKSVKKITGKSPKKLQKEMPGFRFLQF